MADNRCPTSIQVCALRVARLEADGNPDVGPNNLYVSDALVRLTWTEVVSDGEDIESKNGCGAICVSVQTPSALKRVEVELEICTLDPELLEMLSSGSLLTKAGNSRGYALPRIGVPFDETGVSIEAWSKHYVGGAPDADFPYLRWVFPRVNNLRALTDGVLENGALNPTITGIATENANFLDGPAHDIYTLTDQDPDSVLQWYLDTDIPEAECGYQVAEAS